MLNDLLVYPVHHDRSFDNVARTLAVSMSLGWISRGSEAHGIDGAA